MSFRSKVDWWLVLLVLALPGWRIATEWAQSGALQPPNALWVALSVLAIVVIALIPTKYVIEGRTISIQCGLMAWEFTAFPVEDVQSVRPTHNPLASPALSLDRLKVQLASRRSILISPKDKAGFLRAVAALDPRLRPEDHSLVRSA
jgi:membrane protein YdbS with pleckstrin-like domain